MKNGVDSMEKRKIKFNIFLLIIICFSINFFGCFSYSLRAESIVVDETTIPDEITVDDFDLEKIKLLVTRVDGSIDSISLTEDMISAESLKKLDKSGIHNIYIRYDDKLTIMTIKLVDKYSNVTVYFNTNGGNKISAQSIEKNSKAFRPINPVKLGYTFGGWYLDKDFNEEFLFSTSIKENITLYAKWTEAINRITYITNGASSIPDSLVKTGEKLFEIIPNREGYAFDGWYLDEELTKKYDYNDIVKTSFSLYAKWEANKHRITFKCNGGSGISSINVSHNEKINNEFISIRKGYRLEGWYIDKDFIEKYDFDRVVTEDFTLYAKWEIATFKITFEVNGGSEVEPIILEYGNILKENPTTIKDNAIFLGWYLDKDFVTEFDRSVEISEDIILYAKWQMNDIKISFEENGGSEVEDQLVSYGNKAQVPQTPKKIGYIFVGWCTSSDLNVEFDFEKELYEDTIIYAKWTLDSSEKNKYSVVIFNDDMSVLDSFKIEEGSTLEDIVPLKIEYKMFVDWYTDPSLTTKYDLSTKVHSNITLYAKYVDVYLVEYLDKNGNSIMVEEVGEGYNAKPPRAPEVKGYTFVGWDQDLTNVRSNIVTKAIYTTYKYEVKFVVNGNVVSTQKVSNGGIAEIPTDFSEYIEKGYHFKSWDKEIGAIYQDTTYIAVLEKNIYTIEFIDYFENVHSIVNVRHGDLLEKPSNEINDFNIILNWYEDKEFKNIYDFTKPITENKKIYCELDFNQRVTYIIENNNILIINMDLLNLNELVIPSSLNNKYVVSVNNFINSENVKSVVIPNSINKISIDALLKFIKLEEITVIDGNEVYASFNGVLYDANKKNLIVYPRNKIGDFFVIPNGVEKISDYAFSFSTKLIKLDLNNILSIGKEAFSNSNIICILVNKQNIVKDDLTFKDCSSSLKVVVDKNYYLGYQTSWNDITNIIYSTEYTYNEFLYKIVDGNIEIIEYLGSEKYVEIPNEINGNKVTKVNDYAFNSNFDLKGITIPNNIIKIDNNAFYNLKLEYLKINSKLEISTEYMLYLKDMLALTNVYVLDEIYSEYSNEFVRCYKISQIDDDYAYILKDNQWGILQYFGDEKDIILPQTYNKNEVLFIDENFIINKNVNSITINNKISINSSEISKKIYFLVDDTYLDYYLEFDYAFYPKQIRITNDLRYVYGEINGKIIIIKITSKLDSFVIVDTIDGKPIEKIGRYALIENESIRKIEIGKNINEIGKNGLKTESENKLKIIFKSLVAPQIEGDICYESDEIFKIDFNQREYGMRFKNHNVSILNSIVKENEEYRYCVFDEKISIIKYLGISKEISIPSTIDGLTVVSIEPYAFSGKITINKVTVPVTVNAIGYLAFDNLLNLNEIVINSNKVIYIEDEIVKSPIVIRVDDSLLYRYRNSKIWSKQEVFSKSSEVINDGEYQYVIEDGEAIIIKVIQYDYNIILKNYVGNNRIKRLGAYSFNDTDIERMYIYKQIDEIGYNAFPKTLNCLSLSYSLPPKLSDQEAIFDVKVVDEYYNLFKEDQAWNKYNILDLSSEKDKNETFEYLINPEGIIITKYLGSDTSVIIPNEINNYRIIGIGEYAFSETNIVSIKFGEYISEINDYAFYNCLDLETIEFTNNITHVGEKAFDNTKWLKQNINEYIIIGQTLYKYNGKYKLETHISVPDGIVSISPYAFEDANVITEITLPFTLKEIGKGAFKNCINLISIEIPLQVIKIENETFMNCSRLREIIFNKNLIHIGKYAFKDCLKLSEIDFYNVEIIEDYAFSGCEKLSSVILPSTLKEVGTSIFDNCTLLNSVKINNDAEYKIVDGILYDKNRTTLIEDLLKMQKREVTLPSTVSLIKENAFYGSLVEKVVISSNVTIENNAFKNNVYLKGIVFVSNIPTITEESFDEGTTIYFSNKAIDTVKKDCLYDKYLVYSIFDFPQSEYSVKVDEELKLLPICPLEYNDSDITYISSDETILKVTDGKIKALKTGKVYLTVSLKLSETYIQVVTINVEK